MGALTGLCCKCKMGTSHVYTSSSDTLYGYCNSFNDCMLDVSHCSRSYVLSYAVNLVTTFCAVPPPACCNGHSNPSADACQVLPEIVRRVHQQLPTDWDWSGSAGVARVGNNAGGIRDELCS